jgi:pSer/pThr/pTyr-binding forkhead associated (FHA) protein
MKDVSAVRITLPHLGIIKTYEGLAPFEMDIALREGLAASLRHAVYVEVCGAEDQWIAFLRNGQIYNAGAVRNAQFVETSIKEFLSAVGREKSLRVACCRVDDKILHSLLILFEKKPALKFLSSQVDLDTVLDRIEADGKSCVVTASREDFLAVLRYEKGRATALSHEASSPVPRERTFRDDFLVKIYTLSAEKPFVIHVYEDLLVRYAPDAKMIEPEYRGSITELFVSRPAVVTLEFKQKEIGHWMVDKPVFKIGRAADNDIVIDNLAVSRVHSVIEEDKGQHYIRDCDSLNGTIVNGRRVGRALLSDGDQIQIGKHNIVFRKQGAGPIATGHGTDRFDQTVIMHADNKKQTLQGGSLAGPAPRLVAREKAGNRVFEIGDSRLTMGTDAEADIELTGFLVAKRHAEIRRENGHYVIRHVAGRRKVFVGGKPVKEWILRNNDRVKIGKKEFVFEE